MNYDDLGRARWREQQLQERVAFLEETVVSAHAMVGHWGELSPDEAQAADDLQGDLDRLERAVPDRLKRAE